MRSSRETALLFAIVGLGIACVSAPGCGSDESSADNSNPGEGNGGSGGDVDGGTGGIDIGGGSGGGSGGGDNEAGTNACGDLTVNCTESSIGPTGDPPMGFPLPSDTPAPTNVEADGVARDANGYIVLDKSKARFDFLWIADDMAYSVGFVSKVRTTAFPTAPLYREVARYVSVTCQSDAVNGSKEGVVLGQPPAAALCADGVNGCCSRSDTLGGAGHQAVQVFNNRPSRTAVDLNGDVWVANRAFGGQPSATKIANSLKDCIDRNANGVIDTSSDVNNDGIITTDCNNDNVPDDTTTVCEAGQSHEFFGLDDECILFTVNYGTTDMYGRPLALGPGEALEGLMNASDAWAGTFNDGKFYRIDGKTGVIKTTVQIETQQAVPSNPYGAAVDQYGIVWAPNIGDTLYYFNTKNPAEQGMVRFPGATFYGIAIDGHEEPDPVTGEPVLVQQIWLGDVAGSGAYRFRPKRDGTFAGLNQGTWSYGGFTGGPTRGRGLGVDNRAPTSFVWVALDGYPNDVGFIGRIPVDIPDGTTTMLTANELFSTTQGMTTGAGVALDGDVWGINQNSSSAVHFSVDATGNVTGGPDVVPLDDKPGAAESFCGHDTCKPHPYTYSDFTGFGLRNFTNPQGYYAWIEESACPLGEGDFLRVEWDAEVPAGTTLTMMARSAMAEGDLDSATWTGKYSSSPADLKVAPGPLDPNPANFVQVIFELATENDETPKLKSFKIIHQCEKTGPK